MHIHAANYDDFKRLVGVPVEKKEKGPPGPDSPPGPVFPDPKPGDTPEQTKAARDAVQKKWDAEHAPKKVGKALSGTVYYWGGAIESGDFGCVFVSDDGTHVVRGSGVASPALAAGVKLAADSKPLPSSVAPPTFADDFPDAIELDGSPTLSV